ncbi:hypothetical protein QBA54_31900 [Streptomyces sp. B21-108]|uniref:hypothetical protein n=1 Tax=Streptomyces sp. B21-108 TaxID=3039419 RepID=UPI002FF38D82
MSSARHFLARGSLSDADLQRDIQADITSSRNAQIDLQQAGQHGVAARMGEAVDEHLDELNDARNGTWKPRHV